MIYLNFKLLLVFSLLLNSLSTLASENTTIAKVASVSGSINLDQEYALYISDLFNKEQGEVYPLVANGSFIAEMELTEPTWFEVSFIPIKKDRQLGATFPLFLKPGDKLKLNLTYDKQNYLTVLPSSSRSENNAFIAYASFSNQTMRDLFNIRDNKEAYQNAVESYLSEAQSLSKQYNFKNKDMIKYLTVWSYNNYLAVATTSRQVTIPEDRLKAIPSIMDSKYTLSFWNGVANVNNYVNAILENLNDPLERISLKIDKIKELFKTPELISSTLQNDLERYVSSYKIVNKEVFNIDIARLESLLSKVDDEELQKRILNNFKNLHYTSLGSDIPVIKFKDAAGNEVSLEQFQGKYIYIDLWASWCVPCIKEIPYLQELEKLYKDKNLVFVSISLDSDKNAWRNKMNELSLHGHQWELGESNYDKLMNVTGIPHFILYGPDGKLIQYKAPRPSSNQIKTLFNKI
jgi:thiol-disulfide isomerase/thioredoxin